MKDNFSHLRETVLDLAERMKHSLAFELLDFYYSIAETREQFDCIAELSNKILHIDLAVEAAESAYALSRTNDELYASRENLCKAYYSANYPDLALEYRLLNLEMTPNDFDSIVSHAASYKLNNQRDKCEDIIDKLLSCDLPEKQKKALEITQSHKYLRTGRTADGIRTFINYGKPEWTIFNILKIPRWNGIPQPGKTIYINAQGGIGDEIINIRFFKYLKDFGMRPILYTSDNRIDISRVFERNGIEYIYVPELIEDDSVWTQLMLLPADLNLNESKLWYGPYLTPKNNNKNRLKSSKFKIGLKCNGNRFFGQDRYRNIPVEQTISMLSEFKETEIYFFDIDKTHNKTINLKDKITSWDDTFDLLSQMDVVISSCTSVAHAAGSMGIPTLTLVPISEYYIWTSTSTDTSSPWYGPNFHVLKQKVVRNWDEPINQAKLIIEKMLTNK